MTDPLSPNLLEKGKYGPSPQEAVEPNQLTRNVEMGENTAGHSLWLGKYLVEQEHMDDVKEAETERGLRLN